MQIRVDNRDVYVNGRKIEHPAHRIAIAVPTVILGLVLAMIAMLILIPILSVGLLVIAAIALVGTVWLLAWLLLPIIVPALMTIGLFRWLSRR